jgi:hypothetical protein
MPFNPNPANNTTLTVNGVVMNLPTPVSTVGGVVTDGVQQVGGGFANPTTPISQYYVRNAGQPGGAAYAGLADVANSQITEGGVVTKVVSDASGNQVHFFNPAPPQSPTLQAATDSTHSVPSPAVKNPA